MDSAEIGEMSTALGQEVNADQGDDDDDLGPPPSPPRGGVALRSAVPTVAYTESPGAGASAGGEIQEVTLDSRK